MKENKNMKSSNRYCQIQVCFSAWVGNKVSKYTTLNMLKEMPFLTKRISNAEGALDIFLVANECMILVGKHF